MRYHEMSQDVMKQAYCRPVEAETRICQPSQVAPPVPASRSLTDEQLELSEARSIQRPLKVEIEGGKVKICAMSGS